MSIHSYEPPNIPPEIEAYLAKPQQLAVGKSGKVGILQLKLEREPATGKTVIKKQYCRVPLFIQRAIYLEDTLPAMAYLYIISPSGGILQGDRYRTDITLGKNALAHVTTQGATRIYKMENNYGTHMVNIKVDEGGYLEYIPDQIIPFHKSRFYQDVELKVHEKATIIYSEIIVPGRVASGEKFQYDICYIKTIARYQSGKPRFVDIVRLDPKKEDLTADGILGNFEVLGTIYIVTREQYVKELSYEINEKIKEFEIKGRISGGTSFLPARQGIIVRLLGKTAGDVKNLIFEVVRIARNQIIGAPFSDIRKA
jgi:urease accessory protein